MSPFELVLSIATICLAISTVTLSSMLIGAYKALSDMDDDLAKLRGRLEASLAAKRIDDGYGRLPFWGVRRGG